MFKVTDEVMNKLEISRALDGFVLIGVSGQRHNVEQGGICHCLHSLAVWASNLDKMTQCSRADRTAPSGSRAGLSDAPGKANCSFQERSWWLSLAPWSKMSRADASQHTDAAPSKSSEETVSCSHSSSKCCGPVYIPQPPRLPPI